MVHTDIFLWTPTFTMEERPRACVQYSGHRCNNGSTEHSLRWWPCTLSDYLLSTRHSPCTILTAPCLRLGKREWDIDTAIALNDDTTVMADATRVIVAPHASITPVTTRSFKRMVLGLCVLPLWLHSQHHLRHLRAPLSQRLLRPRQCTMALRTPVTRTADNPASLGYKLPPIRDGSKACFHIRSTTYGTTQRMPSLSGPLCTGQSY